MQITIGESDMYADLVEFADNPTTDKKNQEQKYYFENVHA
jgi:hypothetical protein